MASGAVSTSPVTPQRLLGLEQVDPVFPGQHQPTYFSFSPTDAFVYAHFPAFESNSPAACITRFIGTLMMLSVSSHRDKFPVSILGRVAPIGFTAGHRTVAGSMGFHLFDYSVVDDVARHYAKLARYSRIPRLDEFPPFDMTIAFVSEDGASVQSALRGIVIVDDSYVLQVDDPSPRVVLSYLALDYEPPRPPSYPVPSDESPTRVAYQPSGQVVSPVNRSQPEPPRRPPSLPPWLQMEGNY